MGEKLDRAVNLRLPASLHEELTAEAKRDGRKLSDHIRYVLEHGQRNLKHQAVRKDPPAELIERIRQLERTVERLKPTRRAKKKRRPSTR